MRSLFLKIFLYFWLAMTLIGATGILIALNSEPGDKLARHEEQLVAAGRELIAVYTESGTEGLRDKLRQARDKDRPRMFLLNREGRSLTRNRPLPQPIERLAREAVQRDAPVRHRGPSGAWLAMPLDGYLLLTELQPPSRLEMLLNPRHISLRLLITFMIAGGVCWLLARSLTAPLRRMREATRQIAAGQLQTRVAPELGKHGGEIGDLAIDFDHMAERVETLLGHQQRLLRDISHELRSPLARLNVALELARQQAGGSAAAPLNRIELEAERLNEMIGQLLTLTQLESGQGLRRPEPIRLDELLHEIVADAAFEAPQLAIDLQTQPTTIAGSAELLRQAFENIIRNALRHAPADSTVSVLLTVTAETIRISVRDQGTGVPPAALDRLFDPFYRVEDDRARRSGGSGIGLAIAQRAVRLHGGTVTAQNADGGGLDVIVTLPQAVSDSVTQPR